MIIVIPAYRPDLRLVALLDELALDSGLGDSAGAGSSQHGCNGCANQEMLALHSLAHRGASSPVRVKR